MFGESGVSAAPSPGEITGELAGLVAAVDELLALDPDTLGDEELCSALVGVHRQQARLAAVAARLTAAVDASKPWAADGHRNTATWLAHETRRSLGDAHRELRLARRLRSMPATRAALGAGDISAGHAHRLAGLNAPEVADAFAEAEAMLVGHARTLRWADFARVATYWDHCARPQATEADAESDRAARRAHLSPGLRGTGHLDAELDPLGYAAVRGALERIDDELFRADWAAAKAHHGEATTRADLARTPAQRRHDALVEMATRAMTAPAGGKRPRPLISVFVDYETFTQRVCELADGTVITPGTLASQLDQALIERVVFDGPSRVIDLGQARSFAGAARRALEIRDRHCGHDGCHIPGHRCQGDHIHRHADGGPTNPDNGQLRCAFHNNWREQHPDHPNAQPRPPDPPPHPPPGKDPPDGSSWPEAS